MSKILSFLNHFLGNNQQYLVESEAKYRNIVEHSLLGAYIIQDGVFRYVNKKICELLGYTYDEIVDKLDPLYFAYSEDQKIVEENVKKRISGEVQTLEYEFRIVRKDGTILFVKVIGDQTTYKGESAITGSLIDITNQKQAEEALRLSEERLRITLDATQIGIWDWDIDNGLLYVSPIYYTMLGYPLEEKPSTLEVWFYRIHPEDRKMVEEKRRKIINQEERNYVYEARILHADGSYRWHQIIGYVVGYNQGKVSRMVGIRRDINSTKLAEDALKRSEGRLRTLIDTIPDLVWLKDEDGKYMQCNHSSEELLKATEKEIIGKTDYNFFNKRLADSARQKDIEIKKSKKSIIYEELVPFPDGHEEILEIIKTPIFESSGNFIGILGVGRNITERKLAENVLKESEELLKILLKVIPIPIALTDFNGRYLLVNDAYLKASKLSEPEVLGKTIEEQGLIVEDNNQRAIKQEMILNGSVKNAELSITLKDGEVKEFLYSRLIIRRNNIPMILNVSIDVTDIRTKERELEQYRKHLELLVTERTKELDTSNEELHAINEELYEQKEELQTALNTVNTTKNQLIQSEKMASLGILSAGIAHEINNPLNFIHGGSIALELYLKDHLKEEINEVSSYLDAINIGVKRASEIVKSLSHYSRHDDLPKNGCNMHSIIDNCLVILHNQLKENVEIEKHYTEKLYSIQGNEGQLHQAILNIIVNAEQAIEGKGKIVIQTEVVDDNLIVEISDSGVGIQPEFIEKIFDPFFTTKAPGKGTGLGLSITYNIIQEHKGIIEYKSKQNKGTTVIIKLPINELKT